MNGSTTTYPLNGSDRDITEFSPTCAGLTSFYKTNFFSPLFTFFFKAASLLSREANIPFHNFFSFVLFNLYLKQFQVYSTTFMYAPIGNQVFGLLGVKLLTKADRTVAALTRKGREGGKKKIPQSISHGLQKNRKCTRVQTQASTSTVQHLSSQMKSVLFT